MQTEKKSTARSAAPILLALALALALPAACFGAAPREATPVKVLSGQSLVLEMAYDVSTVSIADPKVADAAVGSERTVVVNGKVPGTTSLVVWEEGGRHTLYTVTTVSSATAPAQVMLECKIAELDDTRLKEFGLDWIGNWQSDKHLDGAVSGGLFVTKVETPFNPLLLGPTTDGFVTWDRSDNKLSFMATLRAMEEKGAARIIASPNLVASSGDSASFLAGGEFPVPIARAAGGGGEGEGIAISVTIEWKEFGVRLNFVPTVLDGNRIRLKVAPEVSQPDQRYAVLLNGYYVPSVITRRASTTVELGDGDVLVIGGLKQTEVSKREKKFPILGDIPLLKILFKTKRTETHERDLVIAVSPKIVREMLKSFPAMPGEEPAKVGQAPAPKK
jgi:pilus assembly protein CpaC